MFQEKAKEGRCSQLDDGLRSSVRMEISLKIATFIQQYVGENLQLIFGHYSFIEVGAWWRDIVAFLEAYVRGYNWENQCETLGHFLDIMKQ